MYRRFVLLYYMAIMAIIVGVRPTLPLIGLVSFRNGLVHVGFASSDIAGSIFPGGTHLSFVGINDKALTVVAGFWCGSFDSLAREGRRVAVLSRVRAYVGHVFQEKTNNTTPVAIRYQCNLSLLVLEAASRVDDSGYQV